MQLSTFKSIFSSRVTSDFDSKCQEIRIKLNQIRRIFQWAITKEKNAKLIQQIWRTTRVRKKRIIRKILKIIHCSRVKKTIEDSLKIWKLAEWTRNRIILYKFITLFFKKSEENTTVFKKKRVLCLLNFFFLSRRQF